MSATASFFLRSICRYSSSVSPCRATTGWDPTVSLHLKHPALFLLENCTAAGHFKQILGQMFRLHLVFETFPMSRVLTYCAVSHPENLGTAMLLFEQFGSAPNLYIYNTMISALSSCFPSEALTLYKSMLLSRVYPNEQTLLWLFKACKCELQGMLVHAHAVVTGCWSHPYLQNSLINMYSGHGKMRSALNVLLHSRQRDTVTYNILISGYAKNGSSMDALRLFFEMRESGLELDQFTLTALLNCAGNLKDISKGKSVHAWIARRKPTFDWSVILSNSLLDMYIKCEETRMALNLFSCMIYKDMISWNIMIAGLANDGDMDHASNVFSQMTEKDLVSWNTLISGYASKGNWMLTVEVFKNMLLHGMRPDKVTALALVGAASQTGVLNQGRCVHGLVFKFLCKPDTFFASALIDMYSKCGSIKRSLEVFNSVLERDVTVWTSMISGLAFHGQGIKALKMFEAMQDEGLKPNGVTLLAVLTACSHAGLVDHGCMVFQQMRERYGLEPGIEHYGCLVDLVARAGRLIEAESLIKSMPFSPSPSMWGTLLTSSQARGNTDLAVACSQELHRLEPDEESGYILLSNTYAASEKWSFSDSLRKKMEYRGLKKKAGCSVLIVDGISHEFVASDNTYHQYDEIQRILRSLNKQIKSPCDSFGNPVPFVIVI